MLLLAVYPCTYRERLKISGFIFLSNGISLYPQGTRAGYRIARIAERYIPVPTGNARAREYTPFFVSVYPCTHRELHSDINNLIISTGISLYLQGTRVRRFLSVLTPRYIPVPTGNSCFTSIFLNLYPVYPCTYREL